MDTNVGPTPSWAPPQGQPLGAPAIDASTGTALPPNAADRRPERRGAQKVTDPRARRLFGWETWVVMAVFPLGATLTAIYFLLMHVTIGFEPSDLGTLIPGQLTLSVVLSMAVTLSEFAAAGLVLYLLFRNEEGATAIGLGGHRFRKDLALLLPVWIGVQYLPQLLGISIVHGAHLPVYSPSGPALPIAFLAVALFQSLMAGVVEEIVVLGYLVRRLEQRGWAATAVVIVAVLVRVSYHLYYGPGVLPIVLWATATVLVYRRVRRLLPFIVCHVVWDSNIAIFHYSHLAAELFLSSFLLASLVFMVLWSREKEVSPTHLVVPLLSPA